LAAIFQTGANNTCGRVDFNVKIASALPIFSLKPNCSESVFRHHRLGASSSQEVLMQQVTKLLPYHYDIRNSILLIDYYYSAKTRVYECHRCTIATYYKDM